jgi:plasmid stabilization system protein ParE
MIYKIILQPRAEADVGQVIGYLSDRSKQGAAAWRKSWNSLLNELRRHPERFSVAPESTDYNDEIRHAFFKTRRGLTYRSLFVIADDTVHVIYVRGPGQDLVPPEDLKLP